MKRNALNCWRCGACCKDLVTGVKVTQQEWEALEKDLNELQLAAITIWEAKQSLRLPTKSVSHSKRCAFLREKNVCQVYDRRPEECTRFPIWVIEGRKMITFVISYVCPRAEFLAAYLKEKLPDWAQNLVNDRPYRVVLI